MEQNIAKTQTLLIIALLVTMISRANSTVLENEELVDRKFVPKNTGLSCITVAGGIIKCPFPPRQRNEPSLPFGGNVAVDCGGRTVLTKFVTDTFRSLRILVNAIEYPFFRPESARECRIVVRFPFGACDAYTGVLVRGLSHVGTSNVEHLVGQECRTSEEYRATQVYYMY